MNRQMLNECLEALHPLSGAAEWDAVGWLVESPRTRPVTRVLVSLELTGAVADEVLAEGAEVLICYHPPIFSPLKRLDLGHPLTALLLRLLDAGVSVYSPHTALDAAPGGIADWLCEAFPGAAVSPIEGSGRYLELTEPLPVVEVRQRLLAHVNLPYLRVAEPPEGPQRIRRLALCPGAGASLLREVDADLLFTGEMKHHEVLGLLRAGRHVILSEHGHTERPYLGRYVNRLQTAVPEGVQVRLAASDVEPLRLVLPDA